MSVPAAGSSTSSGNHYNVQADVVLCRPSLNSEVVSERIELEIKRRIVEWREGHALSTVSLYHIVLLVIAVMTYVTFLQDMALWTASELGRCCDRHRHVLDRSSVTLMDAVVYRYGMMIWLSCLVQRSLRTSRNESVA